MKAIKCIYSAHASAQNQKTSRCLSMFLRETMENLDAKNIASHFVP